MRIGVIDIGTNTTRLLVADVEGGSLSPVLQRRHFVNPSRGSEPALAALVEDEAERARAAEAEELVVAGTAALRHYTELPRLERSCRRVGAGPLRILSAGEEARLAFRGATHGRTPDGATVAVVDIGGGSSEIAVGPIGGEAEWWASRPLGSRLLTERARAGDPPTAAQLGAMRATVARRLANLEPPESSGTLAVGGGAASLRRLCGRRVDEEGLALALRTIVDGPAARVSAITGLAPQRVRLLPAALIVLETICELFPTPLENTPGGVREGLALSRAAEPAGATGGP